jgi:hypothetical protein
LGVRTAIGVGAWLMLGLALGCGWCRRERRARIDGWQEQTTAEELGQGWRSDDLGQPRRAARAQRRLEALPDGGVVDPHSPVDSAVQRKTCRA